jgi:hypothetical protein
MPEISRFLGMIIAMYYTDHAPPHFHVRYGDRKASLTVDDARLLEGSLPPRALALVKEWATIHRDELRADWELARACRTLNPIAPLE